MFHHLLKQRMDHILNRDITIKLLILYTLVQMDLNYYISFYFFHNYKSVVC